MQLFLTCLAILTIVLYLFFIDLPHQGLEYGREPFLEDTCLILITKVELFHQYEMLEDESAVMEDIDALLKGNAG